MDDGAVNVTVIFPEVAATLLIAGAPGADFTRTVDGFEATMLVPSARQALVVVGHSVSVRGRWLSFWRTVFGCRRKRWGVVRQH